MSERRECKNNVKVYRTMFLCADVCRFASKYMSCDSSYTKQICQTCAKVCEACVKECERHHMTIVNNVHNYAMNVRRFVEICNIIK
jgi:hypothetical protein